MPISDVEKIVRHEPLETCYEIGKELGRSDTHGAPAGQLALSTPLEP